MRSIKKFVTVVVFFLNSFIHASNGPDNIHYHKIPAEVTIGLYQLMKDIHELFEKHGIPYWVDGGTLLGAVRHKGIIPWDDDLDIGIAEESIPAYEALQPRILELGYAIRKVGFGYQIFLLKGNKTICGVDIFIYKKIEDKISYCFGYYKHLPLIKKKRTVNWPKFFYTLETLYPLKKYSFGSFFVYGPNQPTWYLDFGYPEWDKYAVMYNHRHNTGPAIKVPLTPNNTIMAMPVGPLQNRV